jgi:peptide-methionine (S)-S-oxide reductase
MGKKSGATATGRHEPFDSAAKPLIAAAPSFPVMRILRLCCLCLLASMSMAMAAPAEQTAVFAGGCFWGVDAVFRHVKGVVDVTSGYAGGAAATAHYDQVSTGDTGHAESVRVVFDPARVSYGQLLQVFFAVAHDPTELDRQGPDVGSQYRSVIFYGNAEQERQANDYIRRLNAGHAFPAPIVTQVVPLPQFYPAEDYHQNYLAQHPYQPYIVINDLPKIDRLRKAFPALYR